MTTTSTEVTVTEINVTEQRERHFRWRATPTDPVPQRGKNEYPPIDWRITRRNFNND